MVGRLEGMEMVFVQLLLVGITQCWRLLCGVLSSIYSTKASHAQLPDMSLRRDTQALHLIANIPLIQWGKSAIFVKKKRLHVVVFIYLCT